MLFCTPLFPCVKPTNAQELLTKYICKPYVCFGNQIAILGGRIKESQTSMASRYTYTRHYKGSTNAAHNFKMN
jgi:hypothetical protein